MIHLNLRNLNRFLSVFVLALIVFVVYEFSGLSTHRRSSP